MNLGLPALADAAEATDAQASAILLSYSVASTVSLLLLGRVSDYMGRKTVFMGSLVVMLLGAICGAMFIAHPLLLMICRSIQGIAAAGIIVNSVALLIDSFDERTVGHALGLNTSILTSLQLAGPVVGGLAVELAGPRAIFLLSVPLVVAALIAALLILPQRQPTRAEVRIDIIGVLMSVFAIGGIVWWVSEFPGRGLDRVTVVSAVLIIVVTLAFARRQTRVRHPLVNVQLLAARRRLAALLAGMLVAMADFSIALLMSLYLQVVRGLSPASASLYILPLAVGAILGAPLAGRLLKRVTGRTISGAGLALMCAATLAIGVSIEMEAPMFTLALAAGLVGVSTPLFMVPNTKAIVATVGDEMRSSANALRSTLQNIGGSVGVATCLAVLASAVPASWGSNLLAHQSELTPALRSSLTSDFFGIFVAMATVIALAAILLLIGGRDPTSDPGVTEMPDRSGA